MFTNIITCPKLLCPFRSTIAVNLLILSDSSHGFWTQKYDLEAQHMFKSLIWYLQIKLGEIKQMRSYEIISIQKLFKYTQTWLSYCNLIALVQCLSLHGVYSWNYSGAAMWRDWILWSNILFKAEVCFYRKMFK